MSYTVIDGILPGISKYKLTQWTNIYSYDSSISTTVQLSKVINCNSLHPSFNYCLVNELKKVFF